MTDCVSSFVDKNYRKGSLFVKNNMPILYIQIYTVLINFFRTHTRCLEEKHEKISFSFFTARRVERHVKRKKITYIKSNMGKHFLQWQYVLLFVPAAISRCRRRLSNILRLRSADQRNEIASDEQASRSNF